MGTAGMFGTEGVAAAGVYLLGVAGWLAVWRVSDGYALMRDRAPLLWLPFTLALAFLLANAALAAGFGGVGAAEYEESRFVFIGERATLAVQALASILIVATIVYGLTIRRLPVEFIRFMAHAVIAILGIMAPILWIPDGLAAGFFLLRHGQNAALIIGLFLCVAGVVVMLADMLAHGDARVVLDPTSPVEPGEDGSEATSAADGFGPSGAGPHLRGPA